MAKGQGRRPCRSGSGGGKSAVTGAARPARAAAVKTRKSSAERRIFVLDTNVLMHDPTAIFRFEEHDIYIPMTVLEELDAGKKGLSESARNVRQVSRFLDALMQGATKKQIDRGLPLPAAVPINHGKPPPGGRVFFQTQMLESVLPQNLPGHSADNAILANTLALQRIFPSARITLVSKDINLRIKAAIVGVKAEDYSSDKTIEDADLLSSGVQKLPPNFWDRHGQGMESWQQQSRTFYRVRGPLVQEWQTHQFVYDSSDNGVEAIIRKLEGDSAILELTVDYRSERNNVWGVSARNREQNLALNLLMDPEIDFVTVLGPAGTGKTLLTLAAGLSQTLDHNRFSEIIMTRVTIPLGEDIGFLPGTEEEKMEPWMGALMDNLEVLTQSQPGGTWGRAATNDLLRHRIKIRSLNFMRGRTFLNRFIIIDEAQNLTPKQMKALVTRAGPGTKMICLGNIAQIDTPYLTETTSGLTFVVNRFHGWTHSGHITLVRGERSRLADYASEVL
ncbi:MAG: PhoH family protein [Steroidobacteraceae bacterium]